MSLKVDKGTLLITDGHTNYPGNKIVLRFFKGDLTLALQTNNFIACNN